MSEVLAGLIDKRVQVNGVFDKMHKHPTKNYRVALLQDVTVKTDEGQTIDIGHTWLQDADTLIGFDLEENDRFTCSCRVSTYEKDGDTKYGFRFPTEVSKKQPPAFRIPRPNPRPEVHVPEVMVPEPVQPSAPVQPSVPLLPQPELSVAETIHEVRSLAQKVGGMGRLKEIVLELEA